LILLDLDNHAGIVKIARLVKKITLDKLPPLV